MKFESYEIHAVSQIVGDDENVEVVDDDEADFFTLYGRASNGFAFAIGDFNTREAAEQILSAITS